MMVVPSFDYCTFIWDSCGQGSKSSLDKLNRHAAPVVRKEDSTIHWINYYPVDSAVGCRNVYPLDSDVSGG